MTPAELRDIRNRVVATTDEEVETLVGVLRTWMRRRAEGFAVGITVFGLPFDRMPEIGDEVWSDAVVTVSW